MRQSDNNPAVNDTDTRVRESVRVNSPHQIEFKERVAFPESADSVRYETETYIFLPPALQVTPEHFTSATLLRSLKNYIRLRAPKLPLTAFEDNAGPFADLDSALKDINVRTVNADEDYENAVRRFALTYRSGSGQLHDGRCTAHYRTNHRNSRGLPQPPDLSCHARPRTRQQPRLGLL